METVYSRIKQGGKDVKKQPIHISDEWQAEIDELANLLGMNPSVYGYIPKTLRFSITYVLAALKVHAEVIPDLKTGEMDLFFSSIKKLREKRLLLAKAQEATEEAEKV